MEEKRSSAYNLFGIARNNADRVHKIKTLCDKLGETRVNIIGTRYLADDGYPGEQEQIYGQKAVFYVGGKRAFAMRGASDWVGEMRTYGSIVRVDAPEKKWLSVQLPDLVQRLLTNGIKVIYMPPRTYNNQDKTIEFLPGDKVIAFQPAANEILAKA